ncbi:hypothetical protein Tco_0781067 [Tanacetum coccineum]
MSSSSSHATVTYTSISSDLDSPPWGFPLISESKHEAPEAAPLSSEQAPPSPIPAPVYLEYLDPFDDEVPTEGQPLHTDASPTISSPVCIAISDPIEDDPEKDPEMDPVDYPTDEDEKESTEQEEEHLAPTDSANLYLIMFPQLRRQNLLRPTSLLLHHHHHHIVLSFHYLR